MELLLALLSAGFLQLFQPQFLPIPISGGGNQNWASKPLNSSTEWLVYAEKSRSNHCGIFAWDNILC
jgi:hypothetical protein